MRRYPAPSARALRIPLICRHRFLCQPSCQLPTVQPAAPTTQPGGSGLLLQLWPQSSQLLRLVIRKTKLARHGSNNSTAFESSSVPSGAVSSIFFWNRWFSRRSWLIASRLRFITISWRRFWICCWLLRCFRLAQPQEPGMVRMLLELPHHLQAAHCTNADTSDAQINSSLFLAGLFGHCQILIGTRLHHVGKDFQSRVTFSFGKAAESASRYKSYATLPACSIRRQMKTAAVFCLADEAQVIKFVLRAVTAAF
ncbi:Uncharacterised protein [Klebsiella pneumoniae]|uniref:Uncharacterized protein n=1 Tax=Klebsiella pneumoniae TaxID=573 RepID=A0A377VZW0_KLEPN|nr:Uncharacterised protein [Klebsiella pneumoniae]